MQVIIPMAGRGERFIKAGYREKKPFIKVDGYTMIEQVLKNLQSALIPVSRLVLICPSQDIAVEAKKKACWLAGRRFDDNLIRAISIQTTTEGPASTALIGTNLVDRDDELIIVNCDQIIGDFHMHHLRDFVNINEADGVLGAFISTSPKNSYMQVDPNGLVTRIEEKIVISNIATNGLHYWRRGQDFVDSASRMIELGDKYNGEYYIAPSYNYMIRDGKKVLPFFYNLHHPVGTPEDLDRYHECIKKLRK